MDFLEKGFAIVDDFISQHWLETIVSDIEQSANLKTNSRAGF
jgi:hypothetical protein